MYCCFCSLMFCIYYTYNYVYIFYLFDIFYLCMVLSYLFFLPVHLTVIAGDSIIQQLFYKNLLFYLIIIIMITRQMIFMYMILNFIHNKYY